MFFIGKNLKQALITDYRLVLTKVHRRLAKPKNQYIDMNTKLRTKAKNNFEKDFFKLINN